MGKRGPRPKPTALRVLDGDRADRINTNEPAAPDIPVEAPPWLSEAARGVWAELAPSLTERGVLTAWDADAFAMLCIALARYREASKLIDGSALLVRGAAGTLVKNPALVVQADAERTFMQLAARFGLTPSDRQALTVEQPQSASERRAGRLLS